MTGYVHLTPEHWQTIRSYFFNKGVLYAPEEGGYDQYLHSAYEDCCRRAGRSTTLDCQQPIYMQGLPEELQALFEESAESAESAPAVDSVAVEPVATVDPVNSIEPQASTLDSDVPKGNDEPVNPSSQSDEPIPSGSSDTPPKN
jgi:hypothetical protein